MLSELFFLCLWTGSYHFLFNLYYHLLKEFLYFLQTVEILIRRHVPWRLIWVYPVRLCTLRKHAYLNI